MSADIYSAYDADVNRRIEHSETRIKYWVIGGIAANLLALIGLGAPLVYYLGTLNAQTSQAISTMATATAQLGLLDNRMRELEYNQRSMDSWASSKGYKPPEQQR